MHRLVKRIMVTAVITPLVALYFIALVLSHALKTTSEVLSAAIKPIDKKLTKLHEWAEKS